MIEETRTQEAYEFALKVRVNDLVPGGTSIPIGGIGSLEHRPMLGTQEIGERLRSINPDGGLGSRGFSKVAGPL